MKEKISVVWAKMKENLFWVLFFGGLLYLIVGLYEGYVDKHLLINKVVKLIMFWMILFVVVFMPRRILRKNKKVRKIIIYIKRYYTEILHYRSYVNILEIVHFFFIYTTFYLERILKYIFVGTKVQWLKPYRKNWEKGNIIVLIVSLIYMGMHNIALYVLKIFYEVVLFFDTASIKKIIKARSIGIVWVTSLFYIIGPKFLLYYIILATSIYYMVKIKNIWYGYKRAREEQRTKKIIVMKEGEIVERKDQEQNRRKAFEEALNSSRSGFELGVQYSYMSIDMMRRRTVFIYSVLNIPYYSKRLRNKYPNTMWLRFFDFNLRNPTMLNSSDKLLWKYEWLTRFWEKEFWYTQEAGTYGLKWGGFDSNIQYLQRTYINLLHFQADHLSLIYLTNGRLKEEYDSRNELYLRYYNNYYEFGDIVRYIRRLNSIVKQVGGMEVFYEKYFVERNFDVTVNKIHDKYDEGKINKQECYNLIEKEYRKLLIELKIIEE